MNNLDSRIDFRSMEKFASEIRKLHEDHVRNVGIELCALLVLACLGIVSVGLVAGIVLGRIF